MASSNKARATGIEADPDADTADAVDTEPVRSLPITSQHLRLTQVVLADVSDFHNELAQERHWLLHPSQRELALRGNLFVIEDLAQGRGTILVKRAPLPEARPAPSAVDLRVTPDKSRGFVFALFGDAGEPQDAWTVLEYAGGRLGRTRVLHAWQQAQRPATPGHTLPRLLSNTWGDRSRDSRIQDTFIQAEIDAAHRLGVDVVQLDDGWQQGTTSNSAQAQARGGVWEGFWHADPNFWEPHATRLPQGLAPIVDQARAKGIGIGLWFAPDSSHDFANWQKDADRILELFRTLGIEHFKVDGVKATRALAFTHLQRFFDAVLAGSQGQVVFDLDITAGVRPGYFGAMNVGPLFVENRYTDWHNYWPHQTLRTLWKLSHWVDPRRLRMEFLNHARNTDKYADDPLAPCRYSAAALFATVMVANPLGWFEVSGLSDAYIDTAARLVATWKAHRQGLFSGTILPIGAEPDGFAPTGFLSLSEDQQRGYALVFRELHPQARFSIALPGLRLQDCTWDVLASDGRIESCDQGLTITIPGPLGFLFARFSCSG